MSVGETIGAILETLPVGFRFHPTDEELVDHHLKPKILGMDTQVEIIPEVDICKWEPWELPGFSVLQTNDPEWFFFSPLRKKYQNGSQFERATKAGYWKPTGPGRDILSGTNKGVIGTRKTLNFYSGRGRAAVLTNWIIHQYQYRADIASLPSNRAYVLCRLKRKKDKKTGSNIPTPDEAVAGTGIHLNGPANNMTSGAGPSHHSSNIASDIRNYQVEEMTSDEDPQLPGLLNDITFTPVDPAWFSDTKQGLDLDLLSPSGFNNSYGSMQFEDDTEFVDSLIVDPDEYHCEGLTSQRSSADDSWNLNHGFVGRLSARPQSPLKGVYGKGGGSSSNANTQMLHVQSSELQQTSRCVVSGSKECMQSPMAQQQHATSGLSSIHQHRKENRRFPHDESRRLDKLVAQQVDPKGVKLAGNVSNNDILQAKLTKLSLSMSKLEKKSVSIKARDRVEYGSATDLLQNENPIRESNKNCQVTEKADPNLSSIWNEPVGMNQKGSFGSRETASASHEPSSSPGYLVNLLAGILLLVLDINANVEKPLP